MAGRGRALATTTAVAVVVTVGVAALVGAEPAPASGAAPGAAPITAEMREAPAPLLPPVTTHDLDPATAAAVASTPATYPGQSVTETVQLTIVAGDLRLVTDRASVTLERVPGRSAAWTGALPPVRVIDATGSGAGWDVQWAVSSLAVFDAGTSRDVPGATVELQPGAPVVVAGLADGIAAGTGGSAGRAGRRLFAAQPGFGGGTYEAGGVVLVHLPSGVHATRVVLELAFSLG